MSRRLSLAVLIALGAGGMVAAQPSGAPQAPQTPGPAQVAAPAPPPAVEEAPPISVPTPQPVVVPPIDEKEVAPVPPQNATAPVEAQKPPEAPQHRARFDVAVLQALDKVTAETLRFEAPVGKPIRYKTLVFTVRACERSMPDEPIEDSIAYVEVLSQPRPEPGRPALPPRQAFKGWMFASSPGLNPFEHPVYAAWLISCRAAAPAPAPSPAAAR